MADLGTFNLQLSDWIKQQAPETVRAAVQKLALEALSRIVLRTPVDTGRARSNWFVSISEPGEQETDQIVPAEIAIARETNKILRAGADQEGGDIPTVVLYNNLPYMNRLEHGHSQQAPQGMVAITAAELQAAIGA